MANQTVTTAVNFDSDSVLNLNDGETITINGGAVTIDADNRWGQNNAVFATITISTTIGGSLLIDGTKIWELPFTDGNGIVPELSSLDTNTLSGNNSLATGEFFRVWASGGLEPLSAGTPMPSAGYVKIRSRTGNFQAGETVVLPGSAATLTTTTSGKRSWINVVGRGNQAGGTTSSLSVPRLGTFRVDGDWYELEATTNGQDDQQIQLPFKDVIGAIQVETSPNSNEYEWWVNGAQKWYRNASVGLTTGGGSSGVVFVNLTRVFGVDKDPFNEHVEAYRVTETTTNGIHKVGLNSNFFRAEIDRYTFVTYLKKETRRYAAVQITVDTSKKYTVIVDLDNGDVVSTDVFGSPDNPSHSVTDVGNGWYKVEVSADHTANNLLLGWGIGMSNSSTPTLNATERLPTYTGSVTETMLVYGEEIYAANTEYIATDERGKFFGMNDTGLITFAKRTNGSCGYKPLSGCKIRIPNTILSNAAWTTTYPENSQKNTIPKYLVSRGSRYNISTTAGGALNITKAALNWSNIHTGAFETNFYDCSVLDGVALTNTADRNRIINCGIGSWSPWPNLPIQISTNFTGSRIENTRASRLGLINTTNRCISLAQSNDTIIRNCQFDIADGPATVSTRGASVATVYYCAGCDKIIFEDNICIGGIILIEQTINSIFKNIEYAAYLNGNTQPYSTVDNVFQINNSSSNILVDGVTTFANLTGVFPYGGTSSTGSGCLALIQSYSNNITIQNIGTPSNPIYTGLDASDPNATYTLAYINATTYNLNFKKLYITACRLDPIRTLNTTQTLLFENVWVKDNSTVTRHGIYSNSSLVKGGFYKNINYTGPTSVYGTHWQDFFKSDTEGQVLIGCNEPLENTVDQCSAVFGPGGGFTSAGSVSMINPGGSQVTWTTPYYILGHTSLGYGLSSTNPPFATGPSSNTIQNHEFEYQIDKGSGFSDWKFLFGIRRRSGGGTAGTTTVTVDNITTNRAPSAGDYIWTSSTTSGPTTKVIPGTKITDYDPNTRIITIDTPFDVAVSSNEQIVYWSGLEDEIINPNTGFKLKVRLRPTTANDANAITYISIPTRTDAVSQQIQYQEPAPIREGNITNIIPNSRLQIYNSTTSTEVYNNIVPLSSFTFTYEEGGDFSAGDIARVRLTYVNGLSAKVLFETRAAATEDGWSILAEQIDDTVYSAIGLSGGAITEFATDYPNIEIDINDPDGETSIHRLYSWWVANEYTEDGIRNWAGGLIAEDAANFKVVSSKLDLKLDNLSLSGVQFAGDLRIYRDDGQSPLVTTTTGGGSITLYAGKVYNIVTAQSGLTPSESAQIGSLSAIKINTDLIPGIV
jgi:hypothetical protein